LTLGFAANAVLPARLGDVAGRSWPRTRSHPRLAIFGTIMIERVGDGLIMLGRHHLQPRRRERVGAPVADRVCHRAGRGWAGRRGRRRSPSRDRPASTRIALLVTGLVRRVSAGAGALREPRAAISFLGLTALLATTATIVAWVVATAVGIDLSPIQAVLFLSGIALSLAIPAAPGALGTYEFVGVAIITGLGYTPEQGLATILLMRIITTFPPALIGVGSIWALHVKPGSIIETAEGADGAPGAAIGGGPPR
jgi:hypothetical protein